MLSFLTIVLLALDGINSAYIPDCNVAGCHLSCMSHNCTRGDCVLDQCACFGCISDKMEAPDFWCNVTRCMEGCQKNNCNVGKCRPGNECACFDCNHSTSITHFLTITPPNV